MPVAKSLRVKIQNSLEDSERRLVFLFFCWEKGTKYCTEVKSLQINKLTFKSVQTWGKASGQIRRNYYSVHYEEINGLDLPGSMGLVYKTYTLTSKEQIG